MVPFLTQETNAPAELAGSKPLGESDGALLERFCAGDEDAAATLYNRYADRLRAFAEARGHRTTAARVDADDILQSAFRSFFRRAAEGDYQVPEGQELWQLLVVITLNKIRSSMRHHCAQKRDARLVVHAGDALQEIAADGRNERAAEELRVLLRELTDHLPEVPRRIVHLRLEGHTVPEIAGLTGRSKRTVERVLQDFRRALGERMA